MYLAQPPPLTCKILNFDDAYILTQNHHHGVNHQITHPVYSVICLSGPAVAFKYE